MGARNQPRRLFRPCRLDRTARARGHGPAKRGRDRQRALLRVRGPRRLAPRGRDARGSAVRPADPPPARDRPARDVRLASAAARRGRGPTRAAHPVRGAAGADRVRLPVRPCGAGSGNRHDRRADRLADAWPDALPARRRAPGDRSCRGGAARANLGGPGTSLALLAALRDELRRARSADVAAGRPPVAVRARAMDTGRRRGALARADHGAVARRPELDAVGRPRLPRARARAPAADDS